MEWPREARETKTLVSLIPRSYLKEKTAGRGPSYVLNRNIMAIKAQQVNSWVL